MTRTCRPSLTRWRQSSSLTGAPVGRGCSPGSTRPCRGCPPCPRPGRCSFPGCSPRGPCLWLMDPGRTDTCCHTGGQPHVSAGTLARGTGRPSGALRSLRRSQCKVMITNLVWPRELQTNWELHQERRHRYIFHLVSRRICHHKAWLYRDTPHHNLKSVYVDHRLGHSVTLAPLTSPLVVQHPAIRVHLGGAPGLARVAVLVSAGVVSHIAIDEWEHTRHTAASHSSAGLWGQMTLAHCSMVTAGLTACLEALQPARTPAQDVRGSAACLELRPGALGAAAALVQRVLAALTAGGRGGALQGHNFHLAPWYQANIVIIYTLCPALSWYLTIYPVVCWFYGYLKLFLNTWSLKHAKAARVPDSAVLLMRS